MNHKSLSVDFCPLQ